MSRIVIHRHTWITNHRIICDYPGCYEGSPQSFHDDPFWAKIIIYSILWLVGSVPGLVLAYFFGIKGYLAGFLPILILAWVSRYYGITRVRKKE